MRKHILLAAFALIFIANALPCEAQSGTWTWMHGNDTSGIQGNYGVLGIASDTSLPVGRYQSAYWIDKQGNFWLFGGVTFQVNSLSMQNDMWMYNPNTNQWKWVSGPKFANDINGEFGTNGIPSTANYPSARGYGLNCWTDTNGMMWLYGGYGYDSIGNVRELSDLWKFNPTTTEWTWMNGSATGNKPTIYGPKDAYADSVTPGGLQEIKSSWVDKNNTFYLFGGKSGYMYSQGHETSNDMWQYNPSLNQWRWRKGDKNNTINGHYGIMGVEDTANYPPGRCSYTKWKDAFGNFYIFGGGRFIGYANLNDTWKYNPVTNAWTWLSGANLPNVYTTYGPYCNADTIYPKPRMENQTAQNEFCVTAFWNFGGFNSVEGKCYNDLMLYNSLDNKWIRMKGTDTSGYAGNYGTKGVPNNNNDIGGKCGPAVWLDANNNLWVFGGINHDVTDVKNDLWKFTADSSCFFATFQIPFNAPPYNPTLCIGDTTKITSIDTNWAVQIIPMTGVSYNADSTIAYFTPNTTTSYSFIAVDNRIADCVLPDTLYFTIHADSVWHPNVTFGNISGCTNDVVTIPTDTNYKYNWLPASAFTANADTSLLSATITNNATYTITAQYKRQCTSIDTNSLNVQLLLPVMPTITIPNTTICIGDSIAIPINYNYVIKVSPNNFTTNADTTMLYLTPTTNTTYTIIVSNAASPCTAIDTFTVNTFATPPTPIILGPFGNLKVCQRDTLNLSFQSGSLLSVQPSTNTFVNSNQILFFPTTTTTYTITSTATNHCQVSSSTTVQIIVIPSPTAEFIFNPTIIVAPNNVDLINQSSNASGYQWFLNPYIFVSNQSNTNYNISDSGLYCFTLVASNNLDCKDTVTHCLPAFNDTSSIIYVPNVFSPNADGINDVFKIYSRNIELQQFVIFDRWGNNVFETKNINQAWDGFRNGKKCDVGTYFYYIKYKTLFGVEKTIQGDVSLVK